MTTLKFNTPIIPNPSTDHILGPDDAKVTLVEYGDFECPACRQAHPAVKFILDHFEGDVRFVFRHFPLREVHPLAEAAAEAAEAAGAQGKFWEFYDSLFDLHGHLDSEHLMRYASQLGLNVPRLTADLTDSVYRQRVQEHITSGQRLGIRGTPAFFVNGSFVDTSFGFERLEMAINVARKQA
jgi:protein-disulfide isomerase